MGLNTSTSFATGGAAAATPISFTQVWINLNNSTAIAYTVPAGKYFKGYIGHNSSQNFAVNGVSVHSYFNNAAFATNSYSAWFDIILAPGSTVNATTSSNQLFIHGCEYDLEASPGTTSF
jgi:hypothetical protein